MWGARSILEVYVFCSILLRKFFLKLIFYPVCVHTYVFVCLFMCKCAHTHVHTWASVCREQKTSSGIILKCHPFWVGLAQNLRIRRCWQHGAAGIPCLCFPYPGRQTHASIQPLFTLWYWLKHVLMFARHTLYQWSHPCSNTVKFLFSFLER